MNKKICFFITSMHRGGAERVMSILVNHAAQSGDEVHLILFSHSDVNYDLDSRVHIVPFSDKLKRKSGFLSWIERYKLLKKAFKQINPDLVVSFLTICNMYSCLALRNLKIPLIISERNDPIKDCPSKIKRFLRKLLYRYADGVVFQTKAAQSYFSKKLQNRSVVIPNPVKENLPFADVSNAEKSIVAAAKLEAQKNYPMLLKAFKLFLNDYPDYTLHIYGEGSRHAELVNFVSDIGVEKSVAFYGNVKDLHERIKRAKMFVLSSDYEGISNSLLEALAMGLPSVSTDCPCGGSAMLIDDGVSGLLTPVGDEVAFAEAMKKIAASEKLTKALSENAIKVREIYSEDVITARYFDFFEETMN